MCFGLGCTLLYFWTLLATNINGYSIDILLEYIKFIKPHTEWVCKGYISPVCEQETRLKPHHL